MANAYSQLHNYDRELQTYDFNLIANALSAKEQGLAQGRAMVDQADNMLDQLGLEIDERRPQDREYFQQRYNQAKSVVDKYRAGDLSDPNLANQLVNKLTETMKDERLVNAVVGSKQRKAELQAWAKLREEEPDKFYEGNYALAQQNAEEWYANEAVGAKYKGGGGVREYYDYHKIVNDNVGEIAKFLNADYVINQNGVGMFVETVSGKRVDRAKLEGAIKGLIGEKGMQQMSIEAWYNYDNKSNEEIAGEYNAYLQPKLDENQKYIDSYRVELAGLEEGTDRYNMVKSKLDAVTQSQEALKGRKWENLIKGGEASARKSAYTNMYADRTIGNWVNSYAISSVDEIKVNDNDFKTKEFEAQYKRHMDRMNLEYAKLAAKNQPTTKETGSSVELASGGVGQVGENVEVDYDTQDSELAQVYSSYQQGLSFGKEVFGEDLGAGDLAYVATQLTEDMMGKIANAARNGDEVEFIIGGEKRAIKMTKDNHAKILNFYGRSVQTSPELKQWRETTLRGVQNIVNNLAKQAVSNPKSISNFPSFQVEYVEEVEEGNTVLKMVQVENPEEANTYQELLLKKGSGKKALTTAESKTLDLYTRLHVISDPKVDESVRREMLVHLRSDVASTGVNANRAVAVIPEEVEEVRARYDTSATSVLMSMNPGINWRAEELAAQSKGVMLPKSSTEYGTLFTDPFISSLGVYDTDYEGEEKSLTAEIEDFGKTSSELASGTLSGMSKGLTQRSLAIGKTMAPKEYATLAEQVVGMVSENDINLKSIENSINLYRDVDEVGNPTGVVHYKFSYLDEDGRSKEYDSRKDGGKTFTEGQIRDNLGTGFNKASTTSVTAATTLGKYAMEIPLGQSSIEDISVLRELEYINPGADYVGSSLLNTDYVNTVVLEGLEGTDREYIAQAVRDYDKGEYSFKLVPYEGEGYRMQLFRSGQVLPGIISKVIIAGDPTENEVQGYITDPRMVLEKNNLVKDYISREKFKIGRNKIYGRG